MPTLRTIADHEVFPIGLGCMRLSHGYGPAADPARAEALLLGALDRGVTLFDTAALYGFGHNEALLGRVLAPHRSRYVLASKCGIFHEGGKRRIDGRPATLRRTCEEALTKIMRQAEATRVAVSLEERKGRIVLIVRDNGRAMRAMDADTRHNAALVEESHAAIDQTRAQAEALDAIVTGFSGKRRLEAAA